MVKENIWLRRIFGKSWVRRIFGKSWVRIIIGKSWVRRIFGKSWVRRIFIFIVLHKESIDLKVLAISNKFRCKASLRLQWRKDNQNQEEYLIEENI